MHGHGALPEKLAKSSVLSDGSAGKLGGKVRTHWKVRACGQDVSALIINDRPDRLPSTAKSLRNAVKLIQGAIFESRLDNIPKVLRQDLSLLLQIQAQTV